MVILITGGASSGKSHLAEDIAVKAGGRKAYLAFMKPDCPDALERISRHRYVRSGKGFDTIEAYLNSEIFSLDSYDTILLECVPTMLANIYFDDNIKNWEYTAEKIKNIIGKVKNSVIVTNDIFAEPQVYDNDTSGYIKALGNVNNYIASLSNIVIETVAGIPIYLKGSP